MNRRMPIQLLAALATGLAASSASEIIPNASASPTRPLTDEERERFARQRADEERYAWERAEREQRDNDFVAAQFRAERIAKKRALAAKLAERQTKKH